MADPAIQVEGLGKRYVLNHQTGGAGGYRKFSDTLVHAAKAPLRLFQKEKGESGKQKGTEDFWALKDVSFEIERGEVVGIIGRNGAGKSTLLKILSRITEPTTGRITLKGRVASLLEVGTGFHPELTGRENIFLNGAILGMRRNEIKTKFDEIVAFAEIEKFLDTPVKRYSSGMYVRLAFAVAAHLEPEILIVDEVLAVGDAQFQAKCLGKMQAIGSSGRTVIFVSHQLATVAALCTRAMLLEAGQVRQSGNAKDVLDTYRDAAVVSGQRGLQRERHLHRSNQCAITDADMAGSIEASQPFEIIIEFEVFEPVSLAPEYLIRDENKHPVAFCPTGLQQGFRSRLNAGHYRVSARCPGLDLASGTYFIDLMLAESGVRFFDYYECGLSFAVRDSARPPNGWVFTQKHGQGCFSFAMEVALARLDQAPLPA